jgi:hypothetical protein
MSLDSKITVNTGQQKRMRDMGDNTVAEVVCAVLLIHDTTRTYFFSLESLPVAGRTFDTSGNMTTETRGPDRDGNLFMNTYGYDTSGRNTTESGWVKQ